MNLSQYLYHKLFGLLVVLLALCYPLIVLISFLSNLIQNLSFCLFGFNSFIIFSLFN